MIAGDTIAGEITLLQERSGGFEIERTTSSHRRNMNAPSAAFRDSGYIRDLRDVHMRWL